MNVRSIFHVFGRFFGVLLVSFCVCLRCESETGKLCLDCTGMAGLHVRPSRGTGVFMSLIMFFDVLLHTVALHAVLIDFGSSFLSDLGSPFWSILGPHF